MRDTRPPADLRQSRARIAAVPCVRALGQPTHVMAQSCFAGRAHDGDLHIVCEVDRQLDTLTTHRISASLWIVRQVEVGSGALPELIAPESAAGDTLSMEMSSDSSCLLWGHQNVEPVVAHHSRSWFLADSHADYSLVPVAISIPSLDQNVSAIGVQRRQQDVGAAGPNGGSPQSVLVLLHLAKLHGSSVSPGPCDYPELIRQIRASPPSCDRQASRSVARQLADMCRGSAGGSQPDWFDP